MFTHTDSLKPEMDCTLCTEYRRGKGCTAGICHWLSARIEAGAVDYAEAIHHAFPDDPLLDAWLHTVIQQFPGSLFLNPGHRQRMEARKKRMDCRCNQAAYLAAIYLLTANQDLNRLTNNCFFRSRIEFDKAVIKGISPHNYTLLSAARDICDDADRIQLSALANGEIVDTLAFSLIVNALLIARCGPAVLEIRERSCK